jgi:5-formyltetrahydrofolate cyclo-ligase
MDESPTDKKQVGDCPDFRAAKMGLSPSDSADKLREFKRQIRDEALARRSRQGNAERLSRKIFERIAALPQYANAGTLMLYVDTDNEVRTRWFFTTIWDQRKQIVVPYCDGDQLALFRLERLDELSPGAMRILEPKRELRGLANRRAVPADLDLIIVPGVAFDRLGGRIGHGKGYYDRLLTQVRPDAVTVGICFECQLFPEAPRSAHDVPMDLVVTEDAVYGNQ